MRMIKFRTWDKADGLHFQNGLMCYFSGYLPKNDADAVMQFTGLLDKNGKEIYEGDIINVENPLLSNPRPRKVYFDEGSFFAGVAFHWLLPPQLEVIGNIYENPELLEASKHG